jgi:hypothetical protein
MSIKKINFGAVQAKVEAGKAPKHPVLPVNMATQVDRLIEIDEDIKALTVESKTIKGELEEQVRPFWFRTNQNCSHTSFASSILVEGTEKNALVSVKNVYGDISEDLATAAIGKKLVEKYFDAVFKLTIKSENLPVAKQQDFVNGIIALCNKLQLDPSTVLDVKETVKPNPNFHAERHTTLTTEQNQKLDMVCAPQVAVKLNGVKD